MQTAKSAHADKHVKSFIDKRPIIKPQRGEDANIPTVPEHCRRNPPVSLTFSDGERPTALR